jgi:hypothetical protein
MNLNKSFWENRYSSGATGWDIGHAAPALTTYAKQLKSKNIAILVPGAGRGHEVAYLWNNGFKNITVVDIASQPLSAIQEQLPDFPKENLIQTDFFEWMGGPFDLIFEHTFFCALLPELRSAYVKKMSELLTLNGKLVGLLFDFPLTDFGPPFGGCTVEYLSLFSDKFSVRTLEQATNSIAPRAGRELFFIFEKI